MKNKYLRKVHIYNQEYVYEGYSTTNSTGLKFWVGKTKYCMPLSEIQKTKWLLPIPSHTKQLIKLFLRGELTAKIINNHV